MKGGRGETTIYCAIVCAIKGGGRVPKQRWCLQRISLIRAHTPRSKTISCKGQIKALQSINQNQTDPPELHTGSGKPHAALMSCCRVNLGLTLTPSGSGLVSVRVSLLFVRYVCMHMYDHMRGGAGIGLSLLLCAPCGIATALEG